MTDQGANCAIWTKFGPKYVCTAEFDTLGMLPIISLKVATTEKERNSDRGPYCEMPRDFLKAKNQRALFCATCGGHITSNNFLKVWQCLQGRQRLRQWRKIRLINWQWQNVRMMPGRSWSWRRSRTLVNGRMMNCTLSFFGIECQS